MAVLAFKPRVSASPPRPPRIRGTSRKAPAPPAPAVFDLIIEPSVRRWETPDRYYEAHITSDMFDSLVLVCINGGIGTRRAQMRTTAVGKEQIRAVMGDLCMRRLSRAYLLVSYRRST